MDLVEKDATIALKG